MAPKKRPAAALEDAAEEARWHGACKFKSWVFVLQGEALNRLPLTFDADKHVCLSYQREIGNIANKEHCQGYVQSKVAATARVVASQLGCPLYRKGSMNEGQISFRPARGSCAQNVAYTTGLQYCRTCSAGVEVVAGAPVCVCGGAVDKGRVAGSTCFHGRITEEEKWDAADMVQAARRGVGLKKMLRDHPALMFRFGRQYQLAQSVLAPKRCEKPLVVYLYGESGTGKSKFVSDLCDDSLVFQSWSTQWFDGYDPDEHVVFTLDEVRGNDVTSAFLLRLLDRYPFRLPVKGGSVEMRAPVIVMTSSQSPEELWNELCHKSNRNEDIAQFKRRIDETVKLPWVGRQRAAVMGRCRARLQHAGADDGERPRGWTPGAEPVMHPIFQSPSTTSGTTLEMAPDYSVPAGSDSPPLPEFPFESVSSRWRMDGESTIM